MANIGVKMLHSDPIDRESCEIEINQFDKIALHLMKPCGRNETVTQLPIDLFQQ